MDSKKYKDMVVTLRDYPQKIISDVYETDFDEPDFVFMYDDEGSMLAAIAKQQVVLIYFMEYGE